VWFSLPWSLELYLQTNARLHRSGQRDTVIVHRLMATGTVDHVVADVLEGKVRGLDQLMRALQAGRREAA
jgi:SNF2 family DNA or RNA helicase